jgi:hypothetical protein
MMHYTRVILMETMLVRKLYCLLALLGAKDAWYKTTRMQWLFVGSIGLQTCLSPLHVIIDEMWLAVYRGVCPR